MKKALATLFTLLMVVGAMGVMGCDDVEQPPADNGGMEDDL